MTSKWVTYRLRYRKYLTLPRTRVRLSTANFIHNAQGQTFPILSYRTSQTVDTKNKSFLDSRVTFLVGPTFFHIITLNRPAGSTWSRWDNQSTSAVLVNQSMRECCWIGQKFGKGVNNFLICSYFEKGCRRKMYTRQSRKVIWDYWIRLSYHMKNYGDLGGCYPPQPTASTDNTLLDLQNSS